MDKKDLEKLLMRFSHLGVTHSKNGALLIGKAPHIAEFAWLNIMYPCITEAEVCDLEKKLGCAIPEVYRDFLMNVSNGFDIMNCTLACCFVLCWSLALLRLPLDITFLRLLL